jgi:hypothetical protein
MRAGLAFPQPLETADKGITTLCTKGFLIEGVRKKSVDTVGIV